MDYTRRSLQPALELLFCLKTGEGAFFLRRARSLGIEGDELSRVFVHSTDRSGADVIRRTAHVETCTVHLSFRFRPGPCVVEITDGEWTSD